MRCACIIITDSPSLPMCCGAVTIPARAVDDRFKLVIYYTSLEDPAAAYSQVTIEDNVGSVPIDEDGWWFCDAAVASPSCATGFNNITSMSGNVAPT